MQQLDMNVSVGDVIFFGCYPQRANGEKLPIEWQVLDVRSDHVLVQARYILDVQPYDIEESMKGQDSFQKEQIPLNWKGCTLRRWLNTTFIETAFTPEERARIWVDDSVTDPAASIMWSIFGIETQTEHIADQVFLLSLGDIHGYYPDESAAQLFCPGASAEATPYAAQWLQEPCWWLRTPMRNQPMAHIISPVNSIGVSAIGQNNRQGVRPAMWLNRYPPYLCVVEDGVTEIERHHVWGEDYEICVLPSSVTMIGAQAFAAMGINRKLRSIAFSENLEEIGEMAFSDCTGLSSVLIPNRSSFIDEWERVDALLLPEGVKKIDNFAFINCTGLTSVVIPGSVTSIGYHAFMNCTGLTAVEMHEGVRSIDYWAFGDCTGLTTLVIPDSVTEIGENAFYGVKHIIYNGPAHSDDNWGAESWSRE